MRNIDEKDKEILSILENDARVPTSDLATMVGLSEEEVIKRMKELEQRGVIKKYKAVVDWEKAGVEKVTAVIDVKVTPERGKGYDSVAERVANFPEVRTVYLVSGEYDLAVVVEAKTMKEISLFVSEKLAPLERVHGTNTHFMLKKYKEEGIVVFEREENKRLGISP
ncbi:MAG: Lrp/AsnC family transcriptional regulator [Methanocellales archaeon]